MEQRDYFVILYDFYSELLTEKQRQCFEDYYFNNLSLSEISENLNISRNAIHKSIKMVEKKLSEYEERMQLYNKSIRLEEIINKLEDKNLINDLRSLL